MFSVVLDSTAIPSTYQRVAAIPCWKEVIDAELSLIMMLGNMVPLPPNASVIRSEWVFSVKVKSDGIDCYKARLVAQRYKQVYGIDYDKDIFPF